MNKKDKKYLSDLLYSELDKLDDSIQSNKRRLNFEDKWLNVLGDSQEILNKRIKKLEREKFKIYKIIKELENE